jgi:sugar phosphate isomerase/epimerase
MYKALSPGAIGVQVSNLSESLAAAKTGGFQGVEFSPSEIAEIIEKDGDLAARQIFDNAGIRPAAWGLTVDWRGEEEVWKKGLEELPRLAKAAAAVGGTRCATWVLSFSNDRPLDENRRFHIERFRPIAAILADHGGSLGLEFLGPKTMRDGNAHSFIYTSGGMLDLAAEIGPNVGLLLDCWHWYTSHGTLEELAAMRPEQVVYVHVNDAPVGIPIDEQIDNRRALPGETGVIDIAGFLRALQSIGYDGPVTPEPFKKELGDLPSNEARLKLVGESMDTIFKTAGISPG